MTDKSIKRQIMQRFGQMKSDRSSFENTWADIQRYQLPHHGRGLGSNNVDAGRVGGYGQSSSEDTDGGNKMSYINDSTATRASSVLAAGLMGGLTSPSRPWFRLATGSDQLNESHEVKAWLFNAEESMRNLFAKSNVYKALHHVYSEMPGFGTAAMGEFEDFDDVIFFRPYTIGEYWIATNYKGIVNVFYREFWMTAAQLVEQFGIENVSEATRNLFDNGGTEKRVKVLQAIEPNDERVEDPLIKRWPIRSVYLETGGGKDDKPLEVKGYDEFPIMAPRWFTVGNQTYGNGPGETVLPDVKQLQKEQETKMIMLDKQADPPLVAAGGVSDLVINTFPGGISYEGVSAATGVNQGLRPLYLISPDLNPILNDIYDLRQQIRQGLFNDLFLMIASQPSDSKMTAREVAERHEEKMQLLGPVLESLHDELLTPLIDRTFNIMMRTEILPPPPPELQGERLKIEYISILAQAQKQVGLGAIEQFAGFIGALAQVKPEAVDKLNVDEAADVFADRVGVPPQVVVPDKEVAAQRQARAQQAQLEQAGVAAETIANTAKTLADTPVTGDTALDMVTGG